MWIAFYSKYRNLLRFEFTTIFYFRNVRVKIAKFTFKLACLSIFVLNRGIMPIPRYPFFNNSLSKHNI